MVCNSEAFICNTLSQGSKLRVRSKIQYVLNLCELLLWPYWDWWKWSKSLLLSLLYLNCMVNYIYIMLNSFFSCEGQLCTFSWVLSLFSRYFYNLYIVKMFGIVLSFSVKQNNIFPCLHYIRPSYNIKKCFGVLSIRMCMST